MRDTQVQVMERTVEKTVEIFQVCTTDMKGQNLEFVVTVETDLKGQDLEVVVTGETDLGAREEVAGRVLWWREESGAPAVMSRNKETDGRE